MDIPENTSQGSIEQILRAKYAMTKEEYIAFGKEWDKIRFEILKLLKGRSIPIVKEEN